MTDTDTESRRSRTSAATAASSAKRSLNRQRRLAQELTAAGWQVAAPDTGYVVIPAAAPTDYDGRIELCRELIARFPKQDVINATDDEIRRVQSIGEEFDWEYVLDSLLNARGIKDGS